MLVYATGDLVVRASAFLTIPIYTRLFTPTQFGAWSLMTTIAALGVALLILGGDSAYARYFFAARTPEERRTLTTTWIGFLSAWSIAVTALLLPVAVVSARGVFGGGGYALFLVLGLLSVPVTLIGTMCGQVLRNQFRPKAFVVLNVVSVATTVAFGLIAVVVLHRGLVGLAAATVIAGAVVIPVRLWVVRSMFERRFSRELLRALLAFGVPLVPTAVAFWIFATSDRIVLAKLSNLDEVGVYAVAVGIAGVLTILVGSLGQAWSPHAVRIYEEAPEEASAFFGRVLTYILVGFGVLCVTVTAFAPQIVHVVSTHRYDRAALAVGPLALAVVAQATTQVTAIGMSLRKRTKYLAYVTWAAAVVNLVLNLALVPVWGMLASAAATTASYALLTAGYFVISQKLFRIDVEWRRALIAIAVIVAFTSAAPALPTLASAASVAMRLGYVLAAATALCAFRAVDSRELDAARRLVSDVRARRAAAS